jgi:AAA family ATP:ADP antiporter
MAGMATSGFGLIKTRSSNVSFFSGNLDRRPTRLLGPYRDPRTLISFVWFFFLLFGWYCARPVRETLATVVPESQLKWVMSATFAVMLVVTPVYGWMAQRFSRRTLFVITYGLFVAAFGWFAWMLPSDRESLESSREMIGYYYVWASFFSLFSVSCFWSLLVDVFSTEEGKLHFGRIAAGGTAGSILASILAAGWSKQIGNNGLLAITTWSLVIGGVLAVALDRFASPASPHQNPPASRGSWREFLTAFRGLATSRYLLAIAIFLFVGTAVDIVLYYDVNGLMKQVSDLDRRTSLFAGFNLYSNLAILVMQPMVTPWCLRRLGIPLILIAVPLVYASCFGILGSMNTLALAFAVGILIRVLWLSLVAPAREVLFTSVSREQKYSTKNLIDTVFVRGGGIVPGFVIEPAKRELGSMEMVLWAAIPFALLAASLGAYLGWLHQKLARSNHETKGADPS